MDNILAKFKKNFLDYVLSIIFAFIAIAMIYPLAEQIAVSFSTPRSMITRPALMWFPKEFSIKGYMWIFEEAKIVSGFKNTLFKLFIGTFLNICMNMIAAYFLSRKAYKVKLRPFVTTAIIITMYFGGGLVPMFLLIRSLGLFNSVWAIIIPSLLSTGNAITMRIFFDNLPVSLEESMALDGAGHFTILFRLYFPLSKASIAVIGMYYGLNHWNEWFSSNIYLMDPDKWPIALILRNMILKAQMISTGQLYVESALYEELVKVMNAALVVVTTLPFLCIYPFLQKYFKGGMMIGSLKG